MVPSEIKENARAVQIFKKAYMKETERKWWEPPNKKWNPASGEYGTTPGARHFLRESTWITGEVNQQVYTSKYLHALKIWATFATAGIKIRSKI